MKKVFYSVICATALYGAYFANANRASDLSELQLKNAKALADDLDPYSEPIEVDYGDDKCDNGCIAKDKASCHCYYDYSNNREGTPKDY